MSGIRIANPPCSYGAFEITVGVLPNVPGPEEVLPAIAAAGYEGTEFGPPGYLGAGEALRERLRKSRSRARRRVHPDPFQRAAALGSGPRSHGSHA